MGPRLPARVPPYPAHHQRDWQCAAHRSDRHGYSQGAAGHPEEPGHVRRRRVQVVVQPPQPLLRNPAQARRRPRNHPFHQAERG